MPVAGVTGIDKGLIRPGVTGNFLKEEVGKMAAIAEHFFKAFEHCLQSAKTDKQAMVMAKGYSLRGLQDASSGATHYALKYKELKLRNEGLTDIPKAKEIKNDY